MKDKELRDHLKYLGILDTEDSWSYKFHLLINRLQGTSFDKYKEIRYDNYRGEIRELEDKVDALMELLSVKFEHAHEEPAKLVKGKKEVRVGK